MWMLGSYRGNVELIEAVKARGMLSNSRVAEAMAATDRKFYAPANPYVDSPQPIGFSATISAPHMHASALEHLESVLKPNNTALDVGCGSGYLSAAMARMVGVPHNMGKVIGIDYLEGLVDLSIENVNKDDASLLKSGKLKLLVGDGWKGVPQEGPYDAIHVGAAAVRIPQDLIDQLKPGGKMFIPVGAQHAAQQIHMVEKDHNGKVTEKALFGVAYVPLVKVD